MSEDIIEQWFHLYSNDVYHFLIYYTGTKDVEDLVQEVYIRAFNYFHKFKGESSPKTWLFSIARNLAVDRKRNDAKEMKKQQNSHIYTRTWEEMSPDQIYEKHEQANEIMQAIMSLKKEYRDVVFLRAVKEFSILETASILKCSSVKVRVTYHRALKIIQNQLRGGEVHE
ncbi:RNA polymerase sigma factor [Bacillus sp. FJAT-49736]|uniref:RNA polymerase sigma factor n=1 Tax=Bacillus sp. FJAT-49736 TaxID=2833582 RepID=UPI001BC9604C|nr:RNA polymerase sigma factor [Bacillus sp. FJAT-49736]MBS4172742.1 RNA polymerase sigma factor [Bacillus sp. FJAT-49736]